MRYKILLILLGGLFIPAGCVTNSGTEQQPAASQQVQNSQPVVSNQTSATTLGDSKTGIAGNSNRSMTNEAAALQQPTPLMETNSTRSDKDVCQLLTAAEVESIQSDKLKETKGDEQRTGALAVSRCLYLTTIPSMSVSLDVVLKDPNHQGTDGPRQFWKERFRRVVAGEGEREKEREPEGGRRGEEEEEVSPPLRVRGLGDEAYWAGSRISGSLYVLKGDSYIRISVGGPGDEATKIKKTKVLAQKVLQRLQP
jgi:hypothetical protein